MTRNDSGKWELTRKEKGICQYFIVILAIIGIFAGWWYIALILAGIVIYLLEKIPIREVIISPGRHLIIPVHGEAYGQKRKQTATSKLCSTNRKKSNIKLSLTPQNYYQSINGWPKQPFANINVYGSYETTEDNWLGYIAPLMPLDGDDTDERKERRKYVWKLLRIMEYIPVVLEGGKIIDERKGGGSRQIIIFASRKSIDAAFEKYVKNQHN